MELTLESALSPGGLLGNLSYVLLIASMAMRDIFWLRVLAICSGVSGIAYDLFWLSDPVGVFWESGFTAINLAQWLWLVAERRSCALTPDQAAIRLRVFPSLSELDFRRLVDAAELREVPAGEVLLRRGDVVRVLYLVLAGEAAVGLDDRVFSTCVSDDFIGEIGFTRGVPATATVVATEPMRLMTFDGAWLRAKMADDPEFERAFGFALNANLASKLIRRQQTSDVV